VQRTAADVLVGNLRGQVGETVTTWILLRHFTASAAKLQTSDVAADIANKDLQLLWLLKGKLADELTARLSELGDRKIGRTNFHFATTKLKACGEASLAFTEFTIRTKLRQKRNQEIAHREQPEQWFDDRDIRISYRTLTKGTAMAVRLMKRIDRVALGPSAPYLWRQARKKRYNLAGPARAMYLLVPYMHLPGPERVEIAMLEEAEGKVIWSELETVVDGAPTKVLACKEWGLLLFGDRCLPLDQYPLQKLESITFGEPAPAEDDAAAPKSDA